MTSNSNLRVFRRNAKNIIILWNNSQMDERYHKCSGVFLLENDGVERPLVSSKFVPDNPEKFSKDVDGLVVPHAANSLDPANIYNLRVMFGTQPDMVIMDKQVMSAVIDFIKPEVAEEVVIHHMYGYDYEQQKWVPLPVDPKMYTR